MDKQKLEYFRNLLLAQRRQAVEDLRANKATALEGDDGVEDAGEMSELDLNRSTALTLASGQSQLIEEIDEALGRIVVLRRLRWSRYFLLQTIRAS